MAPERRHQLIGPIGRCRRKDDDAPSGADGGGRGPGVPLQPRTHLLVRRRRTIHDRSHACDPDLPSAEEPELARRRPARNTRAATTTRQAAARSGPAQVSGRNRSGRERDRRDRDAQWISAPNARLPKACRLPRATRSTRKPHGTISQTRRGRVDPTRRTHRWPLPADQSTNMAISPRMPMPSYNPEAGRSLPNPDGVLDEQDVGRSRPPGVSPCHVTSFA